MKTTVRLCLKAVLPIALVMLQLCALTLDANGQVRTPKVTWSENDLTKTIGNSTVAEPKTVTFSVSATIHDASLFVVPELQPYITVVPSNFSVLEPGTQYSVQISYRLPPNALEGIVDGTIHLRSRTKTYPSPLRHVVTVAYGGTIINPDVVSLSPETLALLTVALPENAGLTFSGLNDELAGLAVGKILVLPPADNLPNGFLGRITSITTADNQFVITASPASLSEVFQTASVNYSQTFDASRAVATRIGAKKLRMTSAVEGDGLTVLFEDEVVFDADGNEDTEGDQILLSGQISVNPDLDFSFDIDDGRLEQFAFALGLNQTAELTLEAAVAAVSFEREKELLDVDLGRIVIWVGWVPVVIVPEAGLVAKAEGRASIGIEVGISQASSATIGVGYANGEWHPIDDFNSSFNFNEPTFTAGADVKAGVGPRLTLLLYGITGPRADLTAFLELDVDIFRTPLWQLYGGVEASVGVRLEIFDHTIASVEFPLLIQYRILLGQGGTPSNARIIGQVRDAVTRLALPNSVVNVFEDGSLIDSVLTDVNGRFEVSAQSGPVYRFTISRVGYISVNYENVTVQPNETRTLDVILQVDNEHAGNGTVSGAVFNALSGTGVSGLTISLRNGLNTTTGTIVRTTTTGAGGTYSIATLPAGNYTAQASGAGYSNAYFAILSIGNTTTPNQNGVISPILPGNQLRIILTWGATPSDLDSHFFGPLAGGSRFHMFYPYSGSSSPWPTIVNLDLDDVTSFGPETTTLYQQIDGVYRFVVHDYTNRNSTTTAVLSASQAQVRVYRGSDLVQSFNVPLGQAGNVWTVFEMSGTTITPVNTMSFSTAPDNMLRERSEVERALENLPEKP